MRFPVRLAPAVLVLPLIAACGTQEASSDTEEKPQVVTAFYALEYVSERIAGDRAQVSNLTSPGQEPHDAELTVSQTAEVTEADVVAYLSDFQPVVDEAVAQSEAEHVVDVSEAADLVAAEEHGAHEEEHAEDEHADDHAGEDHSDEPTDDHAEGEGEERDRGDVDPHFWLDPTRLAAVGDEVTDTLVEADPEGEETYRANLEDLKTDLDQLDEDMAAGLRDCERDTVVVSHNAFQYLASRYDLHVEAIAGLSPGAEPSPSHLRELQDLINEERVTTVFSETLTSAQMAESLSRDLGLETAVLDPIEGLSDETSDEDYLSLMRQNLEALQEANGCR
jgi:zinc transport system substrate-binding protein